MVTTNMDSKGHIKFTSDKNTVEVDSSGSGDLVLKVLDVQGRKAMTVIEKVEQGVQQVCLNLADLAAGNYVLNAFLGDTFLNAFRFNKT